MIILKKSKDHLCSVQESYCEHFGFALYIAVMMFYGGLLAIAHALCPAVFQTSASRIIFFLSEKIQERRNRGGMKPE